MEEPREYGLPRATCFVARRLELVAVAGRLWISWCALGGADIFRIYFRFYIFEFLRTHTASCKYEAASCLISLLVMKQFFAFRACLLYTSPSPRD